MQEKIICLTDVIVDNGINPRDGALDQETVLEYSQHIDDLPLMHVFMLDDRYYLTRGFHRFAAHQLAQIEQATFVVHEGDWDYTTGRGYAQEDADLDNLKHGLRLTRAEKRAVIKRYLRRHPERSDVWVANDCYTTDKTVRSVREELEATSEIPKLDKLTGQDGIERPRAAPRERVDAQAEAEKLTPPLQPAPEPAAAAALPVPAPTPAVSPVAEAEPEWLSETTPEPAPATEPKPPPPPAPPPPKPALPPPPPTIRRALRITLSVTGSGALISADDGSGPPSMVNVGLGEAGARVQEIIDRHLAVSGDEHVNIV